MRNDMDLGLMLGEVREQGRQTLQRLGHIDQRMQDGDRLFHHVSHRLHGIETRLTTIETRAEAPPPTTPGPGPMEILIKELLRYVSIPLALWLTGSVEAAVKLLGALK